MKIAFIAGGCVAYDAISNCVRDEVRWLLRAGHNVRLFSYRCDSADLPFTSVCSEVDLVCHPHFQSCDIAIFHFGVFYPLFDAIFATPRNTRVAVVFHNVTPPEFLPKSDHSLIARSFLQMQNIRYADIVVCVSETNRRTLELEDIERPTRILPIAVHADLRAPERKPSFVDGVPRIVFLGRFVASKGPGDLLEAVTNLLNEDERRRLQVDLIGNLDYSNKDVLAALDATIARLRACFGARLSVCLRGNADEQAKRKILANADVFVLPTRHEGFCVPILEALASGCRVVVYDNSNTGAIAGGLAELSPTGDLDALTRAIARVLSETLSESWRIDGYARFAAAAASHLRQFDPDVVRTAYLDLIERELPTVPRREINYDHRLR